MDRNSICYLFRIYERIRSDSPDMKLIKSHLGENIVLVPVLNWGHSVYTSCWSVAQALELKR